MNEIITPNTNLINALKEKVSQSCLSEFISICREFAILEKKIQEFLKNHKNDDETRKVIQYLKMQINLLEEDKDFIKKQYDNLLEENYKQFQELKNQALEAEGSEEEKEALLNTIQEIEKEHYADLHKKTQLNEIDSDKDIDLEQKEKFIRTAKEAECVEVSEQEFSNVVTSMLRYKKEKNPNERRGRPRKNA